MTGNGSMSSRQPRRWGLLRAFRRNGGGGVAITFALAAPVLAIAVGVAVDYSRFIEMRRKMQAAADSAALAATREMRLAQNDTTRASTVARHFVDFHLAAQGLGGYDVQAAPLGAQPAPAQPAPAARSPSMTMARTTSTADSLTTDFTTTPVPSTGGPGTTASLSGPGVEVAISMPAGGFFASLLGQGAVTISVRAQARATSSLPICMISLDPTQNRAMLLGVAARLEAPGCAVHSDSTASASMSVTGFSALRAGFSCSSGGIEGAAMHYTPLPQLDCPPVPDPLASRASPPVGGCTSTDLVISDGVRTLMPGVYCGGLKITGTANVTFSPGEYVIKDGRLEISGQAVARGSYTGFYLTGNNAQLKFSGQATVELSAPKVGPMAGLLFFEDRAAPPARAHEVSSNNVRVLLGTIYLPSGDLIVIATSRVGDMSAYTVVVARRVSLIGTPALHLNAAYSSTDVPVPEGLGPNSGAARLVR